MISCAVYTAEAGLHGAAVNDRDAHPQLMPNDAWTTPSYKVLSFSVLSVAKVFVKVTPSYAYSRRLL